MQSQDRAGMARRGGGRGMRGMLGAAVAVAAFAGGTTSASAATAAFDSNAVTVAESLAGPSGTATVSIPYTVTCGLLESGTVGVTLAAGTATSGVDYVSTATATTNGSQSGNFSCLIPGTVAGTVTATIKGDALDEADETFTAQINDGSSTVYDTATVTITDDDATPTLSVAAAPAVAEGTGTAGPGLVFPVTLSAPSGRAVSVHYATADGTASAGSDYTDTSGTLNIAAGSTTGSITVPVTADSVDEDDETVSVTLSAPVSNATVPPSGATASGTITDDDTATITLSGAAILEGGAGTTTTTNAIVNLATASAKTVTVSYATSDGTATAGSDYTATSGTATIPAGARTASIPVTVTGDTAVEPDETVTVKIKDPANAAIAAGGDTATVTIRNDDVAAPPTTTTPLPGGILTGAKPGSGTPLPTTTLTVDAPITLSKLTYNRRQGSMRFDVRCPAAGGACKGTVTVFTVPDRRSKVKALRKEQQLASKRFSTTAGGTVTLTLKLSTKAKAWLKTAKSMKVIGYAVATSTLGGVSTAKVKATIKR